MPSAILNRSLNVNIIKLSFLSAIQKIIDTFGQFVCQTLESETGSESNLEKEIAELETENALMNEEVEMVIGQSSVRNVY